MSIRLSFLRRTVFGLGLIVTSGLAQAADKSLMHCFTFTAVESATPADWAAFHKASDALPSKIPGVTKVWYGKLVRPQSIFTPDQEAVKKLRAGEKKATGEVTMVQRQYGVCMAMTGQDAYKAYAASPAHKEWDDAYSKVRVEGTTTFDIMGQ
jgi:hypothetical protein